MLKEAMKNDYVFKGFVFLSAALIGFGAWKFSVGAKTLNDVSQVKKNIDSQKISIMGANEDIDALKEEYAQIEQTRPINIIKNGHLVMQSIKEVASRYEVEINYSVSGSGNSSSVTFTNQKLNKDNLSGMMFFEGKAGLKYSNYNKMKEFISFIKSNYPITITSLNSSEGDISISFRLYGV